RQHNLSQLATLLTHRACNGSYKMDEEYFTQALAPSAIDSPSGYAVVRDFAEKHRKGHTKLGYKVLKEFTDRPSGLYLPGELMVKRLEGARIRRVTWKLVRGLYTIENRSLLPDSTPFLMELIEPERAHVKSRFQEFWEAVKAQPSRARYGGVFDYKYLDV